MSHDAFQNLLYALLPPTMVCNVLWGLATFDLARRVRGSEGWEKARALARATRHIGVWLWPVAALNAAHNIAWMDRGPFGVGLSLLNLLLALLIFPNEWRTYKRQVAEDDDDWTKKAKRSLKRLAQSAAASLRPAVPITVGAR